jgi:hypothetical protein
MSASLLLVVSGCASAHSSGCLFFNLSPQHDGETVKWLYVVVAAKKFLSLKKYSIFISLLPSFIDAIIVISVSQ